jgi:hypothetical protein
MKIIDFDKTFPKRFRQKFKELFVRNRASLRKRIRKSENQFGKISKISSSKFHE